MKMSSPCLYNVALCLIGPFQFCQIYCREMMIEDFEKFKILKILKKTATVGVSNSQGRQNTETVTQTCSTEIAV